MPKRNNVKRRQRKRRNKQSGITKSNGVNDSWSLKIAHSSVKYSGKILSSETDETVVYNALLSLVSATQQFFAYPLYTNSAYDADPLVGSTATQGFAEAAQGYNYYRVTATSGFVEFANTSINPCVVFVIHSNTLIGVSPGGSAVNLLVLAGNPNVHKKLLGHCYGQSSWTYKWDMTTIASVVGSQAPETEDNYRANVAAIPVDNTYLIIGVYSTVSPVSMPVAAFVEIRYHTRFYDRKFVSA